MSKAKRMEAKKRKIQAFLEVAELNDNEGRKRASLAKEPRIEEEPVKKEKLEGTLEKWANGEGIWISLISIFQMFSSNEYALRFTICHVCLQGLTGERRYTKSPPKTRSSIFSSKPYNASHYVPSFSSKVHKCAAPDISLSKKCQKCIKRCNCHSHKQLPCRRKSRYLGVPLWPRNCNTKTPAPLPRFLI